MDRDALEASLEFRFQKRNFLVTFHPVTLDGASARTQMTELLAALAELTDTGLIFTMPNADTEGRVLIDMIKKYVMEHPDSSVAHASLGQQRYLSCMAHVDAVVGNSSSGLTEAPSFNIATINIGDRQRGRLQAASVINCSPIRADILKAFETMQHEAFQKLLRSVKSPYGSGGASEKIHAVIRGAPMVGIVKKHFYDLES
jgi:GDP/UDP-N,N'-diacetylbacillosamine 2-epimerase (hydrolysing)